MVKLLVKNVTKRFGSVAAVDDVSLSLDAGRFIALLGPSGCGKTTMLRMIAGFEKPTEGTISSEDRCLSSPQGSLPPERRNMSMIFQSYAVWPNMTVEENVAFGLRVRNKGRAAIRTEVERMLDLVQLGGLAGRFPAELSGGQQQRVALARALVVRPDILLMDEPLSNLDANLREEMRSEIRRVHDELNMTTIYVTHDQSEAMAMADSIVVMNRGRVEQIDIPYRVYNAPATRFVATFIGRANILEASCHRDVLQFGAFTLPVRETGNDTALGDRASFALRPHSIGLALAPPVQSCGIAVEGTVSERTYLGEFWSYRVEPRAAGAEPLHVLTPPAVQADLGQSVWLQINPRSLALLRD